VIDGADNRALDPMVAGYHPPAGVFDEMLQPDGTLRRHWRTFIDGLTAMGAEGRIHAAETAARMLHDNDVTYVAQGANGESARDWRLDMLPLLLAPNEWHALETGLIQRARLLNMIVADLYGPQQLLKSRSLPPALVFGNPEFLLPCHGIGARDGTFLHLLAFDLGRAPDGQWWVLSNRAQAPAGAGYALENRIITSRCLPDMFANCNVHRLAPFFRGFSENLLRLGGHDDHLAVVLSPGPSRSYFEHAFLGRYLGYPIVEGPDLTVRAGRVYLKTLEGLKPVELILRRLESKLCDPLELRVDSSLGVAGLLQAARENQVVIANAVGSGIVENEAIMGFLPNLSRQVLGEDLQIPSIPTWWCGQAAERAHVFAHLDELVVRRAFTARSMIASGSRGYLTSEFAGMSDRALREMIAERPHEYVAQHDIELSTAPFWSGEGLVRAEPLTLRVYVAATKDGYRVMPGGLALLSRENSGGAQRAAADFSKDVWVMSDESVDTFSLLGRSLQATALRRSDRDLPSRTADNLYWLGRYLERAEGAVRLYRSLFSNLSGESSTGNASGTLDTLARLLVSQERLTARRARRTTAAGSKVVEQELWQVLFDSESPDGLAKVLGNVARTADLVRERLSADAWRLLENLTHVPEVAWRARAIGDAVKLLNAMIQNVSGITGMIQENMTRGYGWRLLDMGRRIERTRFASRLVRALTTQGEPAESGALNLLLELVDSTMTYRSRYKSLPQLPAVLDLVMSDDTNPRSLIFQIAEIEEHLSVMPLEQESGPVSDAQKIVISLLAELKLADVRKLASVRSKAGLRTHLDRVLTRIELGADELSDVIERTYFSHSLERQVSGAAGPGTPA
jgi:uncharacterized circularly permuted ATP-grasp superfamily protein/uncharacterized alpha-E superfamily protein